MIEAFKRFPGTVYHLNDLDQRHLFIAAQELTKELPSFNSDNVKYLEGDIKSLELKDQYDAILMARVLHFFSPDAVKQTVETLFNSLKPGGRIYIVAITPYVKRYQRFIPEYEHRRGKG